jgi:hypothetical protein
MYRSLYKSSEAEQLIQELHIENSSEFPNRTSLLSKSLPVDATKMPTEEEFIAEIKRALGKDAHYETCVYEGAEEVLKNMARLGPVRIWTAGDIASAGQMNKIGKTQMMSRVRKEVAREHYPYGEDPDAYIKERTEILSVHVAEGAKAKMTILPEIIEEFKEKGIESVVILEDNLNNLIKAETMTKNEGFKVLPIWVRQGFYKDTLPKDSVHDLSFYVEKYNAQSDITHIGEVMQEQSINSSKPGFIVDYDDVIMDSKKKIEVQGEALVTALKNKNWL